MATSIRTPQSKFSELEKVLALKKKEIGSKFEEHRTEVFLDREPDDEGAEANANYLRDLTLITLERERQTLKEIDQALNRLRDGIYGICSACEVQIPQARLRAIPWTRLCVHCAEQKAKNIS